MNNFVKIKNTHLEVLINPFGAELTSVKKDGTEQIWEGDPNVWSGHSPVLFPICGGLKDDKFIYNEKEYILPKHGFARKKCFEIEKQSDTAATFLLKSDSDTLSQYPFEFEFRVSFSLIANRLETVYSVKNTNKSDMFFSLGAHEAYACPEGFENYTVIFDKPETLNAKAVSGTLLDYKTENIIENSRELPLRNEYFAIDALVFSDLNSRKLVLKNNTTGAEHKIDFDGFDYLLIWTKQNSKYICIEPWCGLPDYVDSDYCLAHKRGIIALEQGRECIKKHTITF